LTLEAKFSGIFQCGGAILFCPFEPSDPTKSDKQPLVATLGVVLDHCRPFAMLIPPGPKVFSVGNQKRFFFSAAMLWDWFILSTWPSDIT